MKCGAVGLVFGSVAMMAIAGCASLDGGLVLQADADGTTVAVTVGDVFQVRLDSNATTGYQWMYREVDDGVLENTGQEYLPDNLLLVGSGGLEVWEFTAQMAGTTTLLLEYVGPGDGEVADTFEVTVAVTEAG